MGSIPTSPRGSVLAWCEAHVDVFRTNAVAIGLTADQALDFGVATETYATAIAAAEKARQEADALTDAANNAYRLMRRQMTNAVADIRQYAEDQPDPQAVYTRAEVPARQDPSAAPPPGQPSNLSVSLVSATGALELRWKSNNPSGTSGTSYIIRRRLPTEANFSFVGVTGERRFVDNSFVAGPDTVEYTVQGQRADSSSPLSEIFVIRFGRNGPGRQLTIETAGNAGSSTQGKLAA
jgi:hypothetical protein